MGAFIKISDYEWQYNGDLEYILYTDNECVFANTTEKAIEILNEIKNPHWPELSLFHKKDVYGQNSNRSNILKYRIPRLFDENILFIDFLEILKRLEITIYVNYWSTISRWEKELGDRHFNDFGVCNESTYEFTYNPPLARQKKEERIERQKNQYKEPIRKKGFIYHHEVDSLFYSLKYAFAQQVQNSFNIENKHLRLTTTDRGHSRKKTDLCDQILEYVNSFEEMFVHGSYRKLTGFQNFKSLWKKHKPSTPKSIDVTQEFFDFMQDESTKRKPAGKIKSRKRTIRCQK